MRYPRDSPSCIGRITRKRSCYQVGALEEIQFYPNKKLRARGHNKTCVGPNTNLMDKLNFEVFITISYNLLTFDQNQQELIQS